MQYIDYRQQFDQFGLHLPKELTEEKAKLYLPRNNQASTLDFMTNYNTMLQSCLQTGALAIAFIGPSCLYTGFITCCN